MSASGPSGPLVTFFHQNILYAPQLGSLLGYFHDTLQECIYCLDNLSCTITVAFACFFSE